MNKLIRLLDMHFRADRIESVRLIDDEIVVVCESDPSDPYIFEYSSDAAAKADYLRFVQDWNAAIQ